MVLVVIFLDWCPLDEMGKRVEDLEKNINELMQQVESREESGAKKWLKSYMHMYSDFMQPPIIRTLYF